MSSVIVLCNIESACCCQPVVWTLLWNDLQDNECPSVSFRFSGLLSLRLIVWMTLFFALQDKQVAVVAGTAADANRVAYVKTVRPSSAEVDEPRVSQSPHRYSNDVRLLFIYCSSSSNSRRTMVSKVKLFHTRYEALGQELIPVYRQSTCRWLLKSPCQW